MMKVSQIAAREIYDSRGWPTVACTITLEDGTTVRASVPTGLSRGKHEAYELRDGGKRLWGRGVLRAVENIEQVLAPVIVGKEAHGPNTDILMLDIDGTADKSNLGANTMLAVSMAMYKAHAHAEKIELYELIAYLMGAETITMPFPQFNLINGGLHTDTTLHVQEFLLVPAGAPNFRASMEISVTVFHELKNVLHKYGKSTAVGDEGGFAPQGVTDQEALSYLYEAIDRVTAQGVSCVIALDVAASQWYDRQTGFYKFQGKELTTKQLIDVYRQLMQQYPIFSLEDPLSEDDWDGWKAMRKEMSQDVQMVGDDLFATNFHRIEQGIKDGIATAVLIKPNQIGTVTETLQTIQLCKNNDVDVIVSHRSGDTEDTFIADLAVGTSAGQIKAGGCSRAERVAKYNRLLEIEDMLLRAQQEE